ncbi:MAG: type II toxin-antitoxin system HicB family antitoxin [Methylomicrobium sp.]
MKLAAIVQPSNRGLSTTYSAYCPDIPGCIAHGPTADKALEALKADITHQINSRKELALAPFKNLSQVQVLEV